MSFFETVRRAKAYLEQQNRVSLRALGREFALDDDTLEELVEEAEALLYQSLEIARRQRVPCDASWRGEGGRGESCGRPRQR